MKENMDFELTFLRSTVMGSCPGGPCDFISNYSSFLLGILIFKGIIFLLSIFPFIVSWKEKVDGKSRIFFAVFACISFYFWLFLLVINSTLCFGFLSHMGPCAKSNESSIQSSPSPILNPELLSTTTIDSKLLSEEQSFLTTMKPASPPLKGIISSTTTTKALTTTTSSTPTTASTTKRVPSTTAKELSYIDATLSLSSPSSSAEQKESQQFKDDLSTSSSGGADAIGPVASPLSANFFVRNISCTSQIPSNQNVAELKRVTFMNGFIIAFLIIVLLANAREALTAKALYHKETLCNKDEVQKFLSSLVSKKPEVGHLINCFHTAKTTGKSLRKVITFSAIENFNFHSWRDFSDVRLIDPSAQYPVIEIDILLNFFPGDHFTAEKYKSFVSSLTKTHSSKDSKITIDDYFHIEDQREWSFFIGNPEFINPWWDRMPFKGILSCGLLFGWPLRAKYGGRMAKHRIEVKKAVFCEDAIEEIENEDEEQTMGSSCNTSPPSDREKPIEEPPLNHHCSSKSEGRPLPKKKKKDMNSSIPSTGTPEEDQQLHHSPIVIEETSHNHPLSPPSVANKIPSGGVSVFPPASSVHTNCLRGQPHRPMPITSPRTHIRESNNDIVTAVTHHDINGVNSTVTLKDIDVKMASITGYETYV
ncbi:uncharacterized protein [Lepeophtheirus salmonis]|uniref:uncharacterized protein n=1 Tax=Lepeophtheirus salmonis TaxID=72036 RepID=UPI001AE420BF|nr:uncharacterized protein LOC121128209 [Lepeophtheirus salmonis]